MKFTLVLVFLIISDIFCFEDDFRSETIDRFPNGFPKEDFREMESNHVTFMSGFPQKKSKIKQRSKDYSETEDVVDESNDESSGGQIGGEKDQTESRVDTEGGAAGGASTPKPEYEYEYVYEDVTEGSEGGGGFLEAWNKRREAAGTITTTSTPWWRVIFNIATAPIVWVGELFNVPGFRKIKSTSTDDYYSNGTVIMRVPHKRSSKTTKSPVKRRRVRKRVKKIKKDPKEGKAGKGGQRSVVSKTTKTTKKPRNYIFG